MAIEPAPVQPGDPAPDFHVVSQHGEPIDLATFRSVRPVALYFMREFT